MATDNLIQLTENKYNRLLSVLFLLLVAIALPGPQNLTKVIVFSLCLIVLLVVIRRIKPGKRLLQFYSLLIFSNLLLLLLRLLGWFPAGSIGYGEFAFEVIMFIVITLPIVPIQKELFATRTVTADTLKGGIAIYLLLGLAWAALYNAIYSLSPEAFGGISPLQNQADLLHFSFTTLTTVGYGDILPMTTVARVTADLEAIVGVIYLAILLARLVSLYNAPSQEVP
jgi:hypothetical protein